MTKKHESQKGKLLEPLSGQRMAFYTSWSKAPSIERCPCPWCDSKMVIACDPDGFVWGTCKKDHGHRVEICNAESRNTMVVSAQRSARRMKKKLMREEKENRTRKGGRR